ncbi:MAG TPA: hypothetical protein VNS58_02240 [Puia sp.]|nr:hypothetical protein [Puia sp.]
MKKSNKIVSIKRVVLCLLLSIGLLNLALFGAQAQIEIIDEAIKAAIMAVDLGIQKIQTETIFLQDAQKQLENVMQQTQLTAITDWVQRQKDLYANYYAELWQVKSAIATYSKVKALIEKQARLVSDYKKAYALVQQDPHFSPAEVSHILRVYQGILKESMDNVNQLALVINALLTQMEDGDRLRIIDGASGRIDHNYSDLQRFTQENTLLSLQRAKDQQDWAMIRALYGLSP